MRVIRISIAFEENGMKDEDKILNNNKGYMQILKHPGPIFVQCPSEQQGRPTCHSNSLTLSSLLYVKGSTWGWHVWIARVYMLVQLSLVTNLTRNCTMVLLAKTEMGRDITNMITELTREG